MNAMSFRKKIINLTAMRTIKFRAWDKANNKFHYDFDLTSQFDGRISWNYETTELTDIELMQFTGLLDKNGKEIYEGDILKHLDGGKGEVVWGVAGWIV